MTNPETSPENRRTLDTAFRLPRDGKQGEMPHMNQALTLNQLKAALAVLSATGLVACGGSQEPAASPVEAKEVPAATTDAAPAAAAPESTAAAAEAAPAAAAPAEAKAPEAATPAPAAAEKPAAADPAKDTKKATGAKQKAAGAKGGCGAGTCA